MTIATQEILFGVTGQTIVLTTDRPMTSVTSVAVYQLASADDSTAEQATTGSASVDSATEATTAAAGRSQADPTKLTVASTTGFAVGRRGLIGKAGVSEIFEIERIDTDAAIYTRHPLGNDYASGATLDMTIRASIAVSNTWAADPGKVSFGAFRVALLSPSAFNPNPRYRVKWTVVHSDTGETVVHVRNVDLVRYAAVPSVSPIDIDDAYPGWLDSLPPDHQKSRGKPLIAEAQRQVKIDLYREGIADQALRNAEVFAALVIAKTQVVTLAANVKAGADPRPFEQAEAEYKTMIASLVESPVLALDMTGTGAALSNTSRGSRAWRS